MMHKTATLSRTAALTAVFLVVLSGSARGAGLEDEWAALYLNDDKVGYTHSRVDLVEAGGRKVVYSREASSMTMKRFNDTLTVEQVVDSFELEDGTLYAIDAQMKMSDATTRVQGRSDGKGKFHLTIKSGGKTDTQTLPWSDDVTGPYAHQRSLREQPMKPGQTRSFKTFFPVLNQITTRTLKAVKREETTLKDGSVKELLLVEDSNGLIPQVSKLWIDDEGTILKTELPFGALVISGYRTSQEVALGRPSAASVDIGFQTLVSPDKPVPQAHTRKAVVYRLDFEDAKTAQTIPETSYQRVVGRDDSFVRLRVQRIEPDGAAPGKSPGPEFTQPNGFIQSDDPAIVATARQVAGEGSAWEKVQRLEKWVDRNMTSRDFTKGFADASQVMKTRQGDCTEHAVLLAAMCRAVGVPARVAMGLVYLEGAGKFGYHMWTEVWIDDGWYAADGTIGQGFIAGGHIKVADGSLKGASAFSTIVPVLRVIDKLKGISVENLE